MLQEIITYIIVFGTAVYAAYRIILFFDPQKGGCNTCASGSCGIKKELSTSPKIQELIKKRLESTPPSW